MTAVIGFPTLRLIRVRVGDFHLNGLNPGESKEITEQELRDIAYLA